MLLVIVVREIPSRTFRCDQRVMIRHADAPPTGWEALFPLTWWAAAHRFAAVAAS
jgi:hypothetical protein